MSGKEPPMLSLVGGEKSGRGRIAPLYDQYFRYLVNFLRPRLPDMDDPQDIAHNVFVRLAEMDELPEGGKLQNYIFSVARNMAADRYRWLKVRRAEFAGRCDEDGQEWEQADMAPLPDNQLEARQSWSRFQEGLDALPPRCREVFILRRVHRMPQREVARRLSISESAVEKHVIKAVLRLREMMGEDL